MSRPGPPTLLCVSLPDLRGLVALRLTLPSGADTAARSAQRKMCRQLLLLHQDLLVSPVPGIFSQIWVVMAVSFYKAGKLNAYIEKYEAKAEAPQRVLPVLLQNCLSFSLTARLAPAWNKAGHLLVQGREFLSQMGKQNAVVLDINVTETQVCLSIEAHTIRLPPPKLKEFGISQRVIEGFDAHKDAVIEGHSILSNWCYVLPSMKMGQIVSILHSSPPDCPFHSYEDFRLHWDDLYGYQLPEGHGDTDVYCSLHFRMLGGRVFTYPLSCVRSQPAQFFPRGDVQAVLESFLSDVKSALPHVCGFPVTMTAKSCCCAPELTQPRVQENKMKPPSVTTEQTLRPCLAQAPCTGLSVAPQLPAHPVTVGRKVELRLGQQTSCVSWALPLRPHAPRRQQPLSHHGHVEVPEPTRGNVPVQDTNCSSRDNMAPKLIPVFKSRSVQRNKCVSEPGNLEGKQHVTESKLFVLKPSVIQDNKLNSNPALKKRCNRNIQVDAKSLNQKMSRPQQAKKTESCEGSTKYSPFIGKSSAVSPSGSQRLSGGCRCQTADGSFSAVRRAPDCQVNRRETLTSKHIAQTLGKGHSSLKVTKPHIFESDTEMEDSQLLQRQSVNQTKQVDVSDHKLMESRTGRKSKRKGCQEPSKAARQPRSSNVYHRQSGSSVDQMHDMDKSKPKKCLLTPQPYSTDMTAGNTHQRSRREQ